jgi:CHAT domain-containing protein/tetratricopeptide (TPR) repeat protein
MAVLALLTAAAVLGALRGQEPAKKGADEPLLKVAGELKRSDPVDPVLKKGFHQVYSVKLAAGAYYQIDLVSKDFDAYLRLEDAKGKQLAEDDDGGGEQNARIVYRGERSGTYRVITTTFDAGTTGKFVLTVKQIDQAAAELQKLQNDANALNVEGMHFYQLGKLQEATERFRRALEMRQALYPKDKYPQGHPDLAVSLNNVAFLLRDQGEYGKAEPFFRQALEMFQALYPKQEYPQGHSQLATSLNNLGTLLHAQAEYRKAEPYYRQALEMRQALFPRDKYPQGHTDVAISLNNVGILLRDQGEYGKAEPFFRQALEMFQTLYPKDKYPQGDPQLATSLNNLGFLLQAQGEYRNAELYFRQALEMRQALYPKDKYPQGHTDVAISLNNVGFLLRDRGEYSKAEPFFRQALEMFQTLYPKDKYPHGDPQLANSLNNLGSLFHAQGEYRNAEPFYRRALEMRETLYPRDKYPQGHRDLAISLSSLASLFLHQGEYAKAEPLSRQALDMYTQLAKRLAQTAPEAVALNSTADDPLSRDAFLSVTTHLPGSDVRTYETIWHSRAALTRVYQRRHLALMAAATDASIRKAWEDLQALRRQREELIMAPAPKNSDRAERLGKLNKQIDFAEQDLLPQLPALKYYEDLAKLGPDALRKLLPSDAVLIDFLRYTHVEQAMDKPGIKGEKRTVRYVAFVVSRQDINRVELGTGAEIDAAVREWREAITAKVPGGNDAVRKEHEAKVARQSAAARRLLWEPIEKRLPAGLATVYLAPDAELTQLPWAALPGKGKDRLLLEDYAVAVLPHGPFLLEQLTPAPPRSDKRQPAAEGLLLVGGIRYDDRPSATVVATRGADSVVEQKIVWEYLKGTEQERQLLAKVLQKSGAKLTANLSGTEAATSRLRPELERCRYAHIGTHGFFADAKFRSLLDPKLFERRENREGRIWDRVGEGARNPLVLSGLVCAGANLPETPERGILSADAIAGLLLDDLHLAVLSACDTGIGDVAGGEGVFGLQRAFHIAGCKNVVASLWKVDDAATAALMVRFYGYLFAEEKARRLPPIEALRRAQLDIYRHPELIPAWAKGEQRAPGPPRPATTPAPPETPPELLTSDGRAPIRLWAAFTLSGAGR